MARWRLQAGKTPSPDSVTSAQALAPAKGKSPGPSPQVAVEVAAHSFSPHTPAVSPLSSQSAAAEPRRGVRRCDSPDSASLLEDPIAPVSSVKASLPAVARRRGQESFRSRLLPARSPEGANLA